VKQPGNPFAVLEFEYLGFVFGRSVDQIPGRKLIKKQIKAQSVPVLIPKDHPMIPRTVGWRSWPGRGSSKEFVFFAKLRIF